MVKRPMFSWPPPVWTMGVLVAALVLLIGWGIASPVQAAEPDLRLVVNGDELVPDVGPELVDGTTFVPVRSVFQGLGATVTYDADTNATTILLGAREVVLPLDSAVAIVNGREVELDTSTILINNHLLVPGRFVAETLGLDVHWEQLTHTVYITASAYIRRNGTPYDPDATPVISYSPDEYDLFEHVVFAEARDEPLEGYIAVAAVIVNRVLSPEFPDTLSGVMLQRGQFKVIENGTYKWEPDDRAREAVQRALLGEDPSKGALYFFDPDRTTSQFLLSRPTTVVIGTQRFAR